MKHGDFTALAENYAIYRPGYAPAVLNAFVCIGGVLGLTCADVGAGTGIWSRQLASQGLEVTAVEPNDAMRRAGERQSLGTNIVWREGSAEDTGLPSCSFNMVTMASSFHWPDFDAAMREFARILVPGGIFMALWNTRDYEANPLLADIEKYLYTLVPGLKRVSSGRSEFCDSLFDRLSHREEFDNALYMEGRHTERQTPDHYVGLWESVNDVRVQAGEDRFNQFISYVRERTRGLEAIDAEYLTRAWIVRRKD